VEKAFLFGSFIVMESELQPEIKIELLVSLGFGEETDPLPCQNLNSGSSSP
jgi:hypothetical protein